MGREDNIRKKISNKKGQHVSEFKILITQSSEEWTKNRNALGYILKSEAYVHGAARACSY